MLINASHIVTLEGPILKDHSILVENGIIQAIAPHKELSSDACVDLPNTILLPGLVNCHCHLELSKLPEPLPYPGSFVGWIDQLTRLKLQMSPADIDEAIAVGIRQLMEGGTTTVADHLSVSTSPKTLMESSLDGIAYVEVLGLEEKRAEYFYEEALEKLKMKNEKFKIIATPHATYSLLPEVFSKLISTHTPLSIHIAESAEEYLLFKENRGPLLEFLQRKGQAPATLGETPVQYLERLKLLPQHGMAIHANYLEEEDIAILNEHQMSVVHCPGSHVYFDHDRFPLGLLQDGAINVALGTDSLASNNSLSMLEQMRLALDHYAELTPETVLKMATINGAKALGKEKEIGSIKIGKRANLIGCTLRLPKQSLYENILQAEKTSFTIIRGVL